MKLMNSIDELLSRGVTNVIPGKEKLVQLLNSNKTLNVYLGIDPTSPRIHLGHAVNLRRLQRFADMGHNVVLVVGDFTALIGDTSDKESERPQLTREEIKENLETYKDQASNILDFSKIKIRHNSEWLEKMQLDKLIELSQHFSFGDFAGRELVKKRLIEGKRVGLHEALYPVLQGYDSLYLKTDIQLGGADQIFNMQAGRTLIKDVLNKDSFIISSEYLIGTDGKKMSKTWNNAIWLSDKPNDMYAKLMRLSDNLISEYFVLATNLALDEIKEAEKEIKNPMELKKKLARRVVRELHNDESASKAEQEFEKVVQKHEIPQNISVFKTSSGASLATIALDNNLVNSRSEWKRMVEQKGVYWKGKRVTNPSETAQESNILQIGNRKHLRVEVKVDG